MTQHETITMEFKTLNDFAIEWGDGFGIVRKDELKYNAIRLIKELRRRANNLSIETVRSSDVAYAATEGIINLRKIEDDQVRLTKVELIGGVEALKRFLNIEETDLM